MMIKLISLYSVLVVNCLGCHLDQFMMNGTKWSETKLYEQFLELQVFDYEAKYHNLSEMMGELKRISRDYSDTTKLISLGKTSENRDIPALIVSKSRSAKFVVFECGAHAREWISVSFCLWSIDKLLHDPTLLNSFQFLFVPVLNPDGYVYTWEIHRFWRKNRIRLNGTKCSGIDINRNWDTNRFCEYEEANMTCRETYCGETPFSSAEAKALSDYLIKNADNLFAYFSIHSFGQSWMYPWTYTNETVPNSKLLAKLSEIGVKSIYRMYGTQFKYGKSYEVMYPAPGVSIDWVYDTLQLKIVFAIELRDDGYYGFLLPCYLIKAVCEETWAGVDAVLNHLIEYQVNYSSNQGINFMVSTLMTIISLLVIPLSWLKI